MFILKHQVDTLPGSTIREKSSANVSKSTVKALVTPMTPSLGSGQCGKDSITASLGKGEMKPVASVSLILIILIM